MNLSYVLGATLTIPFLPVMYVQGKRIKARVPKLPEASGTEGLSPWKGNTQNPIKLLTIGESTLAGVGVQTHEEGFSGTLARELSRFIPRPVQWKVYAKSGYNAQQVREEILPSITESYIDLLVVGIGGNDAFELNTPGKWKKEVTKIILDLKARFPDTPIVFCCMPPIKAFPAFTPLIKFTIGNLVELLGRELAKVVATFDQVYYQDERITLKNWLIKHEISGTEADFFSDGVHPSKLAYQTWAKDVAQLISKIPEAKSLHLTSSPKL